METKEHELNAAVVSSTGQTQLGEGIRWDSRRDEMLAVDILAGRVARARVLDDGSLERIRVYQLPETVGMIAPVKGDDGWLLGAGRGFVYLAVDGSQRTIAEVSPAETRMNDGACDPQGRFWGGTLANDHHEGGGALYRLDRDGRVEQMLDGLTISNGVGWSPDGLTMYLVDSGPRVIHAFAFDGERGTISAGRILATVPDNIGSPDGMTVDAAGDLWVAIYGGGRVHRYAPNGTLREVRTIPAPRVHMLCLRRAGPEPALRHDRDRGLDQRAAARRPHSRTRLPARHRCDRPARTAIPSRPHLVAERDPVIDPRVRVATDSPASTNPGAATSRSPRWDERAEGCCVVSQFDSREGRRRRSLVLGTNPSPGLRIFPMPPGLHSLSVALLGSFDAQPESTLKGMSYVCHHATPGA